jgi:glycosyltransferase involved in cell wall biosynthesis
MNHLSQLKIALIQSLIGGGGGNDMVFNSLINHLSKTHDVTVFTFSKPHPKPNYKYQTMMPMRIPFLGLYQNMLTSVKKIDDFDLIISLSKLFIKTKKPVIFYNQNIFYDAKTNPDKYNSIFWKMYYKPFKSMLGNRLKNFEKRKNIHVINSSEFSKINMNETLGINSTVVYPPVKLAETKTVAKDPDTVVSLGRFSEEKNFEFGIESMKLAGYKYKIIGSTNTISSKTYLKKLQDMANNNISFLVNPTRNQIITELSKAKVILGLSNETFGIAIVEGISSGCIPIVRNTSGNKETVPIQELRFDSESDLIEKIRNAMEGYYDVYLQKLHDHIQQFDESNFHKNIDKVIQEVMQ